jgi:hypothetical protein
MMVVKGKFGDFAPKGKFADFASKGKMLKARSTAVRFPAPSDRAARSFDLSKAYVVRSLNCTTNKPLHLGHLRNLGLGAATAGTLQMLGARVVRHCILEDTGRFMTEAMAAVRAFERSGQTRSGPAKSDHFVGSCYRRYRENAAAVHERTKAAGGKPVAASTGYDARNDEADDLMRALLDGDEAALQLRANVRSMALEGQQATLQRLGVWFDSCDYESDEDPVLADFIAACSERGLLRPGRKGGLGYLASGGRRVPIMNRIGLAEESARLLSFNWRLARTAAAGYTVVIMAGSEWKESMSAYAEVLNRLGVANSGASAAHAFYGMVRLNGKKMASSTGSGILVDDLLDRLAADERILEYSRHSAGGERPDELAAMVLKCFLLSFARTDPIDFTFDRLGSVELNAGWAIAAAWTRLTRNGAPSAAPTSRSARRICAAALSRLSFERAVARARTLAERIRAGHASAADENDFRAIVAALGLVPRRTEFVFDRAGPLRDVRVG